MAAGATSPRPQEEFKTTLCAALLLNHLSAFVLVGKKGDSWHSHCRFWLPELGLAEKAAADHAPYDLARAGTSVDGARPHHRLRLCCPHAAQLFRQHNIQKVAYDPWHFDFFKPSLLRAGFTDSTVAEAFCGIPADDQIDVAGDS